MAGFVPVAKNLGEAIGYSTLDLISRNITPGKVAASIHWNRRSCINA